MDGKEVENGKKPQKSLRKRDGSDGGITNQKTDPHQQGFLGTSARE